MRSLVRWGVKSVGGLAANLVLLTLWVDGVGIGPALALPVNFVLISAASYVVTDRWVFADGVTPDSWRAHARQWAGTEAAMLAGKAANYVIYLVLLPFEDYRVAWVVGAVATFLLTYGLNQWWWTRGEGRASV